MLVPIDDLADAEQLEAALMSSGARLILTTAHHLDASGAILNAHDVTAIRVDEGGRSGPGATASQVLADKRAEDLPVAANNEPAMLSWTSGTTGSPKQGIRADASQYCEQCRSIAKIGGCRSARSRDDRFGVSWMVVVETQQGS
jgi:acyl-coenzyme A synthetase/AMP-(fatty) acid ligase